MARTMRSRRFTFAAADHCIPVISISGGGKSGNRRLASRPLLPRNDDDRIESGSLSVSDGEAAKSLNPRVPPVSSNGPRGVLTGVFCCGGVAVTVQKEKMQQQIFN